tara:strand:+ start:20086 stop:21003 length:918 start_codon:yes stop_codon:yes gene_type:complete
MIAKIFALRLPKFAYLEHAGMPWKNDHLASVETLLFRSALVKVGSFECGADDPCQRSTDILDNDVFVVPQRPVWIRRNSGSFRFAEPGAILMHRAGSALQRRFSTADGERTYWFGVHPDIFVESLLRHKLSTRQMGGALIVEPRFRYRLAMFLRQLDCGPADRLAVEEAVLTLFFEICEMRASRGQHSGASRSATNHRQRRLADKARAYLDAHLAESVGLETVAAEVGASLYHLCRVFRRQTGMTMHAYRTHQRLGHVVDRLVDGNSDSLAALALDTGFASHSHLSRVFQKALGIPPSAIRSVQP